MQRGDTLELEHTADKDLDPQNIEYNTSNNTEDISSSPPEEKKEEEISLQQLQIMHRNSMQHKSAYPNGHNTRKIVDILGGIDAILMHYITVALSLREQYSPHEIPDEDDDLLIINKVQTKQLYNLISQEQTAQTYSHLSQLQHVHDDVAERELNLFGNYSFSFYTHNTILYKLVGGDGELGRRVMRWVYSKLVVGIQCGVNIAYPIMMFAATRFSSDIYANQMFTYGALFVYVLFTIYFSLLLCTVNEYAMRLVTRNSFEFWLKLLYTLLLCVSYIIYQIHYGLEGEAKTDVDTVSVLCLVFQIASLFLMVLALCCVDALQFPSILKFCGGITLSVLFVSMSLYFTFVSFSASEVDAHYIALTAFIGNASRVVAMYLIHHTYLTLAAPDKCVALRYVPHLNWIDKYDLRPNIDSSEDDNEDEDEHVHQLEDEHEDDDDEHEDDEDDLELDTEEDIVLEDEEDRALHRGDVAHLVEIIGAEELKEKIDESRNRDEPIQINVTSVSSGAQFTNHDQDMQEMEDIEMKMDLEDSAARDHRDTGVHQDQMEVHKSAELSVLQPERTHSIRSVRL